MKVWVAILSILGGLAGLASGLFVTAAGSAFSEDAMASSGAMVFWLSGLAIVFGFVSWIPKMKIVSAIILLVIAIVGIIQNGLFFIPAFIFLGIAGVLAFFIKSKKAKKEVSEAVNG